VRSRDGKGELGQASVELVALLPLIALLAALLWQAVVAGQAIWVSGAAARAAARAGAVGGDRVQAARQALPARLERGLRVRSDRDGAVAVVVGVPAVIGAWRLGTVRASARFEPQGS
jgi:hypothetical protein